MQKQTYFKSTQSNTDPASASVCDKCIKVVYNNKYVYGRIVDSCPGCRDYRSIDVSPKLFSKLDSNYKDVGVIYVDWEFADCSKLGSSGECDGTCKASGSSDEEVKKTTAKKTTTKKATTTTRKVTTTTVAKKPSSVVIPNVIRPTSTVNPTLPIMPIANPMNNNTTTTAFNNTMTGFNNTTTGPNKMGKPNQVPVQSNTANTNTNTNTNTNAEAKEEKEEESTKGGNSYVLPITGALVISGAAGIGLLYAKRNSNNYDTLKAKFPEAFTQLKRSLTRGSTNIRRGLTRSGNALKRSLSKKSTSHTYTTARVTLEDNYPVDAINYSSSNTVQSPETAAFKVMNHPYDPTYQIQNYF